MKSNFTFQRTPVEVRIFSKLWHGFMLTPFCTTAVWRKLTAPSNLDPSVSKFKLWLWLRTAFSACTLAMLRSPRITHFQHFCTSLASSLFCFWAFLVISLAANFKSNIFFSNFRVMCKPV